MLSPSGTASDQAEVAGLDWDAESQSGHAWARQYNPRSGMWLTPDPYNGSYDFANPQTFNRYIYVGNDPMSYSDPSGLARFEGGTDGFGLDETMYGGSGSSNGPCPNQEQACSVFSRISDLLRSFLGGLIGHGDDPPPPTDDGAGGLAGRYVASTLFATAQGPHNVAQQQNGQKLKYKTVSGGQHSSSWEINWSLTHNTKKGGWIVQHIVADFEGSTQCGGHGQCNYWEAWQVDPNSHTPLLHGLDANGTSYSDRFGGGAGSHIHASATFYEGLTLPSSFTVQPEGFPAADLRSTTTNPNLPTDNATAPNVRWWGPQ
jgi:RHS repeat-associated protein